MIDTTNPDPSPLSDPLSDHPLFDPKFSAEYIDTRPEVIEKRVADRMSLNHTIQMRAHVKRFGPLGRPMKRRKRR